MTETKAAPTPLKETVTPSGLIVRYYEKPRRFYEVGDPSTAQSPEDVVFEEAISVTTALKIINKEGLSWWGMRIGGGAVIRLIDMGICSFDRATGRLAQNIAGTWQYADEDSIYAAIKEHKLAVKDVLADAGERGTGVHDALEAWAVAGVQPKPLDAPMAERMYVEALRKFTEAMGEAWVTDGVETTVGSAIHLFAGRYDLRGHITEDVTLVTDALTKDYEVRKRGAKSQTYPAGTSFLLDAKTSKGVYTTHFMQLEGYEGAGTEECGIEPTDKRAVIHLSAHGVYQFVESTATYDDFLVTLEMHRRNERIAKEANL